MVYPLDGDSATCSGSRYLVEEPLVNKPSERQTGLDGGGISSMVRIWSIVVEFDWKGPREVSTSVDRLRGN